MLGAYVGGFVDELARAGLRHVCLCPGSRSTPLALVFRREPRIKVWTHLDERSCGFFGLGMAKALREPVALVCTSGTAAANFTPAVVEGFHAGVPLLVLTADRPPELRGIGATQTIDQNRLYGAQVKWFAEMLLPEASPAAIRHVRTIAARALGTARADFPGPVHVNFPFREPLVPARVETTPPRLESFGYGVQQSGDVGYVKSSRSTRIAGGADLERLAKEMAGARRGLVVCGPQDDPDFPAAVGSLTRALGWPVLADVLSGARCGRDAPAEAIDRYDALLRNPRAVDLLRPDFVLRFGATPVSKPLSQYLERHAAARQVVVGEGHAWPDSLLVANEVVRANAPAFCQGLAEAVAAQDPRGDAEWPALWRRLAATTGKALAEGIGGQEPSEPAVFALLADLVPEGTTVFAGNSMPVRDLDTFMPKGTKYVRFMANRGASGIDGVVSSALGAAAASDGRLVLCIGDISFYHDMNGLLAALRHGLSATIVLLNNDGGGIFSFLPQAEDPEHFEELFGTPHGLDFRPAAKMYGLSYVAARTQREFGEALKASFEREGVSLIEVRTERSANVTLHRALWGRVNEAVAGVLEG